MDETDWRPGRRVGWIVLMFAAASLVGLRAWAVAPDAQFDIPAGDAVKTLLQFSRQAQIYVLYDGNALEGVRTRAVQGTLSPREALARMLEGTGLEFVFDSETSVLVMSPATVGKPGSSSTDESALSPQTHEVIPAAAPLAQNGALASVPEVIVTGSFIRGAMDLVSPLEIITRKEMKVTAYATVQDAIQTLTFSGGAIQGEDFAGTGNFNRGTAISLRGLGAGATLVLVNGRRQPQAGIDADFVDVSNIPWSMVEKIDVLSDGTSALYGSDAIAGVVNVRLREHVKGAEFQARVGSAPDGAAEAVVSQLLGNRSPNGSWLLGYEYRERSSLSAADRWYAADSNKTSLGGRNFSSFRSNPGNILDPITFQPVYAIPKGQDGTNLEPTDLLPGVVNWQNLFENSELLPEHKRHSVYLNASKALTGNLVMFAEGRYSSRRMHFHNTSDSQILIVPSTNPFFVDPFGGSPYVIVAYSFIDDLGILDTKGKTQSIDTALGVRADISSSWQASGTWSYAQERMSFLGSNFSDPYSGIINLVLADSSPETAFNPFGDGSNTNPETLDRIRFIQRNSAASEIRTLSVKADGSLSRIPGKPKLAVGIERREEVLNRILLGRDLMYRPQHYSRYVTGAFMELSAPLLYAQHLTGTHLELSVATRYERYSDFGSSFSPKLGLRLLPTDFITLRASWGSSFKAPKLVYLYDVSQNANFIASLKDPISPVGQSVALIRQGSNPDLNEETSATWTAGVDLTFPSIPGLSFSLTGYDIDYNNQIIRPGGPTVSPLEILFFEFEWADIINRSPSQDLLARLCSSPDFIGPVTCALSPPSLVLDTRMRNFASTRIKAVDVDVGQMIDTNFGRFAFGLSGTYSFSFVRALTRASPKVDMVDTVRGPLALRLKGSIEWNLRLASGSQFDVGLVINHTGGYRDTESPVRPQVSSLTSVDLSLSYGLGNMKQGWLNGAEFVFNAVNLTNIDPPFVDRELGYDVINSDPFGRVISFQFRKTW